MGFIEDIEEIIKQTPEERQTALFSATISPEIGRMAKKYMRSPRFVTIKSKQLTVDSVEHRYYLVNQNDKLAVLTRLFEVDTMSSTLIFAKTRVGTSELVTELMGRGFPAEALNGDLNQITREQVLNRFRRGKTSVLVATDVAARGLDIDGISHVINYDLPLDPEMYVHRVGRTGRAGKTGVAISLMTHKEEWRLRRIENYTKQKLERMEIPSVEEIEALREKQLLERIKVWLERGRCQQELQIVRGLIEEGQDPVQIAASALKLVRSEEKQRPIARLNETMQAGSPKSQREFYRKVKETGNAGGNGRSRSGRDGGNGTGSTEMVRMTLGAGKNQGMQPADVVGTIAYHANIPGSSLGKITIHDKHTLVEVPLKYMEQTLASSSKLRFKKSVVTLGLA